MIPMLILLAILLAVETALLVYVMKRSSWQREAGGTAVVRGKAIAERMGCFGCHGPGGAAPIANPGARAGEVPSWTGGTWMMFNDDEQDVRQWITQGHPEDREPSPGQLIAMPAYGKILSDEELDDLVAYVLAVSQFGRPSDERVAEGRDVAERFGCFGCHGPEGRGLVWNPGSFKGYIPGWDGDDYLELVRDDGEFREWVQNGITERFRANPAASHFLESQPIKMPTYGERITDAEIDALLAYVSWVRSHPRAVDKDPVGEISP